MTSSPERQERARRNFPSAVILSKPEDLWHHASHYDLVVVASPNRTHVPLGIAAMEAGLSAAKHMRVDWHQMLVIVPVRSTAVVVMVPMAWAVKERPALRPAIERNINQRVRSGI